MVGVLCVCAQELFGGDVEGCFGNLLMRRSVSLSYAYVTWEGVLVFLLGGVGWGLLVCNRLRFEALYFGSCLASACMLLSYPVVMLGGRMWVWACCTACTPGWCPAWSSRARVPWSLRASEICKTNANLSLEICNIQLQFVILFFPLSFCCTYNFLFQ